MLEKNLRVYESMSIFYNNLNLYSTVSHSKVLMWSSLTSKLSWPPVRPFSVQAPHLKEEAPVLIVMEGTKLGGMLSFHQSMSLLWYYDNFIKVNLMFLHFFSFESFKYLKYLNEVYLVVLQENYWKSSQGLWQKSDRNFWRHFFQQTGTYSLYNLIQEN